MAALPELLLQAAGELGCRSVALLYIDEPDAADVDESASRAGYTSTLLGAEGVRADVIPADRSLEPYDLVIAPVLHVMPAALADRLRDHVEAGGHLVTTYFSGHAGSPLSRRRRPRPERGRRRVACAAPCRSTSPRRSTT